MKNQEFKKLPFKEKIQAINKKLDSAKEQMFQNIDYMIEQNADLDNVMLASDELLQNANKFRSQAGEMQPWWQKALKKMRDNIDLDPRNFGKITQTPKKIFTPDQLELLSDQYKRGYLDLSMRNTYKNGFFNVKPHENEALQGNELINAIHDNNTNKSLDILYKKMKSLERQGKMNSKDWRINRQIIKEISGKDLSFVPNKTDIINSLKDYDYDLAKAVSKEFKGMKYIYPQDLNKINNIAASQGISNFNAYDFPSISREMNRLGDYQAYSAMYSDIKNNEGLVDGALKYGARKIAQNKLGNYGAGIAEEAGKGLVNGGSISKSNIAKGVARGAMPYSAELELGKDVAVNAGENIYRDVLGREKLPSSWKDSVRNKYINFKNYANKKSKDAAEWMSRGGIEVSADNNDLLPTIENSFRKKVYPNLNQEMRNRVDDALSNNKEDFLSQWLEDPNGIFRPEHYFDDINEFPVRFRKPVFNKFGIESPKIIDNITDMASQHGITDIKSAINYAEDNPFEFLARLERVDPNLTVDLFPNGMQDVKEYLAAAKQKVMMSPQSKINNYNIRKFETNYDNKVSQESQEQINNAINDNFEEESNISDLEDFFSVGEAADSEEEFFDALDRIEGMTEPQVKPQYNQEFLESPYYQEKAQEFAKLNADNLNKLNNHNYKQTQILDQIGAKNSEVQQTILEIGREHEINDLQDTVGYIVDHPKEFLRVLGQKNPYLAKQLFPNGSEDVAKFLNTLASNASHLKEGGAIRDLKPIAKAARGDDINSVSSSLFKNAKSIPDELGLLSAPTNKINIANNKMEDLGLPSVPTNEVRPSSIKYDELGLPSAPTNEINNVPYIRTDESGLPVAPRNKISLPRRGNIAQGMRRAAPIMAEQGAGAVRDTGRAIRVGEGALAARNNIISGNAVRVGRGSGEIIGEGRAAEGVGSGMARAVNIGERAGANTGRLARAGSKVVGALGKVAKLGGDVLTLVDLEQKASGLGRLWKEDMERDIKKDGFWGFFEGVWDSVKDSVSSGVHYAAKFGDAALDLGEMAGETLWSGGRNWWDPNYKPSWRGNYLDRAVTKGIGGDPLAERVEDNHSLNPFDEHGELASWVNQGANNLDYIFTGETGWGGDEITRQEAMNKRAAELGLTVDKNGNYIDASENYSLNAISGSVIDKINQGWFGPGPVKMNGNGDSMLGDALPSVSSTGKSFANGSRGFLTERLSGNLFNGNQDNNNQRQSNIGSSILLENSRQNNNRQNYKF